MNDISFVTISGNLTRDLEERQSSKGTKVITFDIANNRGPKDQQKTSYYKCVYFGDESERMVKAKVKKGSSIIVIGEIEMETYEKTDGTKGISPKIIVKSWQYVPTRIKKDDSAGAPEENYGVGPAGAYECDENGLPM